MEIQKLEAKSRAPIFSHLATTLAGIESLRSYKSTGLFSKIGETLANRNNRELLAFRYVTACNSVVVEMFSVFALIFMYIAIVMQRYENE